MAVFQRLEIIAITKKNAVVEHTSSRKNYNVYFFKLKG
ncbi:hypothetical protein HDE69_000622 [Pedobacter cryoconitis]|uniref:Uncharacterized protein n=1 Tax=Pedobacter cryoconitis TaxID=188932 RepID=A0A7W9DIC9_9SPHI|nr:hypothetical protein [Pedobacter cryoconitis]